MGQPSRQLALDTNVLLDLADGEPVVSRFHRIALQKKFSLAVTFTVLRELGAAAMDQRNSDLKTLAHLALSKINFWQITPIPKNGLFVDYAEDFSKWFERWAYSPQRKGMMG